jgi:hypothetical protein
MIQLGELMVILDLHRQGLSITAIARRTGRDPKTVRKYIARGLEPPGNYYSVPDRTRRIVEVHQLPDVIRILDQGRHDPQLTVGPLSVFLRGGRHGSHLAVIALSTQPAEKRTFQVLRIELVCLGPPIDRTASAIDSLRVRASSTVGAQRQG